MEITHLTVVMHVLFFTDIGTISLNGDVKQMERKQTFERKKEIQQYRRQMERGSGNLRCDPGDRR